MLYYLLVSVHVLVCFFLVVVVLLQSGKAADLAGAFGGMGSQTAFGPRGAATVLSKATTVAAGLFMITSLTLGVYATRNAGTGRSVLERQKPAAHKTAPVKQPPAQAQQPAAQHPPAGAPGTAPAPAAPSVTMQVEGGKESKPQPLPMPQQPPAGQPQPAPKK